jgi:hypothetical protein
MTRIRLILLSAFAALAISAVASASASAEVCPHAGTIELVWCINKIELGSPNTEEAPITIAGNTFILRTEAGLAIECKKLAGEAKLIGEDSQPPRNSDVEIKFTECSVAGNPKCVVRDNVGKVNGTIKVGPEIDSEVEEIGGVIYDRFFPSEGTNFVTLEILNKGTETCLVANPSYPVTGETCAEGEPLNTEAVTEKLVFKDAADDACNVTLKLKGVNSEFEGTAETKLGGVLAGKTFGVARS